MSAAQFEKVPAPAPKPGAIKKKVVPTVEAEAFVSRTREVEAKQITAENMINAAVWADGVVHFPEDLGYDAIFAGKLKHLDSINATVEDLAKAWIKVNVVRPQNERQTKGFVGDWLVKQGRGFKVYSDSAFQASFERKSKPQIVNVINPVEAVTKPGIREGLPYVTENTFETTPIYDAILRELKLGVVGQVPLETQAARISGFVDGVRTARSTVEQPVISPKPGQAALEQRVELKGVDFADEPRVVQPSDNHSEQPVSPWIGN